MNFPDSSVTQDFTDSNGVNWVFLNDAWIRTLPVPPHTHINAEDGGILEYISLKDKPVIKSFTWHTASSEMDMFNLTDVTVGDFIVRTDISKTYLLLKVIGTHNIPVMSNYLEILAPQYIPTGGTTGQILAKKSNADFDVEWVDK